MAGKVLNIDTLITKDELGCQVANYWVTWNTLRQPAIAEWEEVRKYVYATDTTQTTNSKLPWKNKTTIPKLCQIRDNLYANYMMSLFPKRRWLDWEADEKSANAPETREAILDYMGWVISQDHFRTEMGKLVLDYLDYGNAFAMPEWMDERQNAKTLDLSNTGAPGVALPKVGYVGPAIRRISPLDIVFNPTAPSFLETPKIIRSLVSLGEVKSILENLSTPETKKAYEDLWNYLLQVRTDVRNLGGSELTVQDSFFRMDGFTSFRSYLESEYAEILTFYGDIFNLNDKSFRKNAKIMVVDRHKVIYDGPSPSLFGHIPIYHVGWRPRQDNLWAMGPLANLLGLQYRLDHVENLKADVFDLLTFPPLKIKGYVEDFNWGPFEKIYVGDEGDVEMLAPPFQVLQANMEIANLMQMMEEMAGAPKEAMGFRTPGEKTKYEVQRLENAASRIFTSKIVQFEMFEERLLNAMLELAWRNMDEAQEITIFDDEFRIQTFRSISPQDITGAGKLRPRAARHFAEKAETIQNLTAFANSAIGQDPSVNIHISGLKLAQVFEELLEVRDYGLVQPFIRLAEQAEIQRRANAHEEQVNMELLTPTGLTPDDYDEDLA